MNQFLSLFTRASKLLREAADDAMRQHGVRVGQNIILEVLWQQDGLTPGEIARCLDLATPTVVNAATRMEEVGLLVRRPDPADGRLVRLHLTRRARAVRRTIEKERSALERRATRTLTESERRVLDTALAKIIEQLTEDRPSRQARPQ